MSSLFSEGIRQIRCTWGVTRVMYAAYLTVGCWLHTLWAMGTVSTRSECDGAGESKGS
jgi:hypothetical protein